MKTSRMWNVIGVFDQRTFHTPDPKKLQTKKDRQPDNCSTAIHHDSAAVKEVCSKLPRQNFTASSISPRSGFMPRINPT